MTNQPLPPNAAHVTSPPPRAGGALHRGARACLFGGTIFAAGIAHADATFTFAVGPSSGYATQGIVEFGYGPNTDSYSATGATVETALITFTAYRICNSYSYFDYLAIGSVATFPSELSVSSESYFCDPATASLSGYFLLAGPTAFRLEWEASPFEPSTIGIWNISDSGTDTLVAGPGADVFVNSAVQEFILTPGLYRAGLALRQNFGRSTASLFMLGDACLCDIDANGSLNLDDVDAFVTAFLSANLAADLDGNGTINLDDLDAFIACFLATCL